MIGRLYVSNDGEIRLFESEAPQLATVEKGDGDSHVTGIYYPVGPLSINLEKGIRRLLAERDDLKAAAESCRCWCHDGLPGTSSFRVPDDSSEI